MSKISKGRIYIFEGPDGVGKTTLIKNISSELKERSISNLTVSLPGLRTGTLGELVYRLHHDPAGIACRPPVPESLQLMHLAAHCDTIANEIQPALSNGKVVLLDRYWWSTWVYGKHAGINNALLNRIIALAKSIWKLVIPENSIILSSNSPFRKSIEPKEWKKLSSLYLELLNRENPKGLLQIESKEGSDQIVKKVLEVILTPSKPKKILNLSTHNTQIRHLKGTQVKAHNFLKIPQLEPLKPTIVYRTFWEFAAKRQKIFFARMKGDIGPWIDDPILETYKFTNAYRAADRVSQYLIREVIYKGSQKAEEVLFRILLFKTFNKIETWELLKKSLGSIKYIDFNIENFDRILSERMNQGKTIYSAAYIMTSGKSTYGYDRKHSNHLALLKDIMNDGFAEKVTSCDLFSSLFQLLRGYPTIGDFLAYQYAIDINYSDLVNFNENDFVVAGPGARNGVRKCFHDFGGLNEEQIIAYLTEHQEREFMRFGVDFSNLWSRPLKQIDIQNLFCETDKYSRVAHPDVLGIDNRTRIKRKFSPEAKPISYWFPPKWGINNKIRNHQ